MCTEPVPGRGLVTGSLLLVGDYPDDETGEPFKPDAWDLLLTLLEEIDAIETMQVTEENRPGDGFINRGIYFTTAVKCGTTGKHKPRAKEMKACRKWLGAQIGTMRPKIIVALGNLATASLTGKPLSKCKVSFGHGNFEMIKGQVFMPTLHPNYVIRRGHAEWGHTRSQLRTDLDAAWRASQRGLVQPEAS